MSLTKFLFVFLVLLISSCAPSSEFEKLISDNNNFDLLISNGTIVDGSGDPPYMGDLLIRADTIAYIGKVNSNKVSFSTSIDASGKVVTPGFIDVHSHGNPLSDTPMDNFLKMGVTTIVLGQDGSHPSKDQNGSAIDLPEWMNLLSSKEPQVNVAMLAGHATLRRNAGVSYADDPTETQLIEMKEQLKAALDAGCYGMSTGLEYVGGMAAEEAELVALAKVLGGYDGIMMSHVRNEDDDQVEKSLDELLNLGEHCKVHVSHMKVVYGKGAERANEILQILESARNEDVEVSADVYPYLASYTGIGIVFPKWAKTAEQFNEAKQTRNKELRTYLFDRVQKRNGPSATLLAANEYAGKTLEQAAADLDISFVDLLMQIGPNGGSGAYFIMEDSLMSTFLLDSDVMVSSDGSPTMRHPRGHGTFARIIERYVVERGQLAIEEAVRKMTTLPAATLGIEKRGSLRVGNFADVLVFDPSRVKENATYLDPYQTATGFDEVVLNGIQMIKGDSLVSERSGRLLRKNYL